MNIRKSRHLVGYGIASYSLLLLSSGIVYAQPHVRPEDGVWLNVATTLQRMIILGSRSYAIDYSCTPDAGRALVTQTTSDDSPIRYYLFGKDVGIVSPPTNSTPDPRLPERWTIIGDLLLLTWDTEAPSNVMPSPMLLKYPLAAFVVDGDGRGVPDGTKFAELSSNVQIPGGFAPIGHHQIGITGWKEGVELGQSGLRVGRPPDAIHYDFRALSGGSLELYLTADGEMQQWLYDVGKWRLRKINDAEIQGPFLVCSEGTAVVTERDKYWCLIGPLDSNEPQVRRIVKKSDNAPFLLIEDRVAGTEYFEQEGKVYDADGDVIGTVEVRAGMPTKTKELSDLVRSRRSR